MNPFWSSGGLMAGLRPRSALMWGGRYVLACLSVAVAMGMRLVLEMWVGPGLPTYITFYPAVMVVALLVGFGPGLVATLLTCYVVAFWVVPPIGEFSIGSNVDRLGLVIFFCMGLLMSLVAQLYRRNRDLVAAYEREQTLGESREILRRQAELIDPARAEVIAREMERVVLDRDGADAVALEPADVFLRRVPDMAGAGVAGVGVLVLVGWLLGLEPFKSVFTGLPRMKPNTAFCFMIAGVALVLREKRTVRLVGAGLVCVVVGLTLAESISGMDFGIDQFLFREIRDQYTTYSGRMAEATAAAFLLSGASLLLLKARTQAMLRTQQLLALGVAIIGTVVLLGFSHDVQSWYRLAGYASMALHTALLFIVLAAGLLVARPDGVAVMWVTPGPGSQMIRRLLPAALLVPMVLGSLIGFGFRRGWYGEGMDLAILTLVMILTLVTLVGWTARSINRADAARRMTETQLRNLTEVMNHAHEPMIVREYGGVIRAWNRGAEALYGWSAAEVLGQRKQTLLNTAGYTMEELDHLLASVGHWEGELMQTTRDGRSIIVESHQTARSVGNDQVFILESNLDITERKQAENKLRDTRKAALNLMRDSIIARQRAEQAESALRTSTEEIRNLNQILESRVLERTNELRQSVTALETEILNRQRLEREILEISEREQSRLGQDLHDGLGQELSGIAMLSDVHAKLLFAQSHPSSEAAAKIASHIRETIDSARRLAKGLYPIELNRYGLPLALKDLADQTSRRSGIPCELLQCGDTPHMEKSAEIHIYRIIQEGIGNAIKHGKPSRITIESLAGEGMHLFTVTDDGVGFKKPAAHDGMGLHLMEYRARLIGAEIKVEQPEQGGCRVTCRITA